MSQPSSIRYPNRSMMITHLLLIRILQLIIYPNRWILICHLQLIRYPDPLTLISHHLLIWYPYRLILIGHHLLNIYPSSLILIGHLLLNACPNRLILIGHLSMDQESVSMEIDRSPWINQMSIDIYQSPSIDRVSYWLIYRSSSFEYVS